MSLRAKLLFGFLAAGAASVAVFCLAALQFQKASTREAQSKAMELLLDEATRTAQEGEASQDPLLLLDTLKALLKTRPELASCRVLRPGIAPVELRSAKETKDLTVARREIGGITLEFGFSNPYLKEQAERHRKDALADLLKGALAVIPVSAAMALILSWRLSRRFTALGTAVAEIGKGRFGISTQVGGIDEIGKLAREIDSMSSKLHELETMKKTFVASVTHELRSPLAAIESTVKLILSQPTPRAPVEVEMFRRIQSNAGRLGRFVTNMLEMAKIERGKLEYRPARGSLQETCIDAAKLFEPRAAELGVNMTVRSQPGRPPELRFDPDLVTQVVSNLLSNALKFTPRGGTVEVEVREVDTAGRWAECRVRDSGVGIPKDQQSRLFSPFERIPNAMRMGGAGLGLAICKSILEIHKGGIGVDSVPGKGSLFWFRLPLA